MSKVGKRRAMRAAPPLMIDKGFARKFVELSHDYHPRLPVRAWFGRMMESMQVEMRLFAGAY